MIRLRLALALVLALLCGACGSKDQAPPAASPDADVLDDAFVDDDAFDAARPPLDPASCPKVAGDEAPLSFSRDYVPLGSGSIQQDKAFYFATVLDRAPGVNDALAADAALATLAKDREARFRQAATRSGP
jgi:hypothetical protein